MSNARTWSLGAFIALLPVSVEIPAARDSVSRSGETRVTVTRGMGTYAIIDRGCEGQVLRTHPHTFDEISGEMTHRFANGLSLGVSGGRVHDQADEHITFTDYGSYPARESTFVRVHERENKYVIPRIGWEGRGGGVGVGWIFSEDPYGTGFFPTSRGEPTFHIRAGRLDGLHFRISWLETVPLYSSGRFFDMGVGAHPGRLWDFYAGIVGGGPYDGPGFTLKVERRIHDHITLAGNARLGHSGGEPQSGFALSLGYVSAPPVEPRLESRKRRPPMGSAWGLAPREVEPDTSSPAALDAKPPVRE